MYAKGRFCKGCDHCKAGLCTMDDDDLINQCGQGNEGCYSREAIGKSE